MFLLTCILELISERNDVSSYRKHTRLAIGTLVAEGAQKCGKTTVADLNRWASAIRNAFFDAFNENWSIVVFTGEEDSSAWTDSWFEVDLGNSRYSVVGNRYMNSEAASVWADRFNDFFIREFACQQWVPQCKPVADSLYRKYKVKFDREVSVVVVWGGLVGADSIGRSFSHSGHKVWIIAQ
jgi:hypothetical protein